YPDPIKLRVDSVAYDDWRDLYREKWTWDRVAKSSHNRANCFSACSWNLFVKDGIVWREEQNAVYDASRGGLPDFNPRGCQKGACHSDLEQSEARILHPLRRVGERGEGKWKRISWDEAYEMRVSTPRWLPGPRASSTTTVRRTSITGRTQSPKCVGPTRWGRH
ncbi:MAG: molybdopterin-dependent oxidoreductase, partial [Deltaproteobacteria bacterium]|nr:molybdopterin-dependent oxidoreductase [Deltaproteobacteria bacterium]